MTDLAIYLVKTYGLAITILLGLGAIVWIVVDKVLAHKLKIAQIREEKRFELDKMEKVEELKIREKDRQKEANMQIEIDQLMRIYHEMLDDLLVDLETLWRIETSGEDPKYFYMKFGEHTQRIITYTRSNTRKLGLATANGIENEIVHLNEIIQREWHPTRRMYKRDFYQAEPPYTPQSKKEAEQILRDLMARIQDFPTILTLT